MIIRTAWGEWILCYELIYTPTQIIHRWWYEWRD